MSAPKLTVSLLSNPVHFFALGFGSGLAPKAPGTFGTLTAIPLYLLLMQLPFWFYIAAVLLICLIGIYICDQSARDIGVHDHPGIVFDEFAGFFITMIAAPEGTKWVVLGFLLFRLFDILKPWPIRLLDRHVKGGFGIMVDDILAGFFALVCLQLIHLYIWQ